jgi:hypothetical protein
MEEKKKIEIHLHGYAKKISCPYVTEVRGSELENTSVVLFLSRNKIEQSGTKLDIKHYYNCSLAEGCKKSECVFRRGYVRYDERVPEEAILA